MKSIFKKIIGKKNAEELQELPSYKKIEYFMETMLKDTNYEITMLRGFLEDWEKKSKTLHSLKYHTQALIFNIGDKSNDDNKNLEIILKVEKDIDKELLKIEDINEREKINQLLSWDNKNWQKLKIILQKKQQFFKEYGNKDMGIIYHNINQLISLLKEQYQILTDEKEFLNRLKEIETHLGTVEKINNRHDLFNKWRQIWIATFCDTCNDINIKRKRLWDFDNCLRDIQGNNSNYIPKMWTSEEFNALMEQLVKLYEYGYKNSLDIQDYSRFGLLSSSFNLSIRHHDPKQIKYMLKLYQNNNNVGAEVFDKFLDAVYRYSTKRRLTEENDNIFGTKLLNAIINKTEDVKILLRGGNIWGMYKNDFGIGDYICHCFLLKICSQAINELIMIERIFPTSDFNKFEQNRLDALSLGYSFGSMRDFIHDQRPHVNELIDAMIEFYDTKNPKKLNVILPLCDYFNSENIKFYSIDLYNKECSEINKENEGIANKVTKKIKSIDILRRLKQNTKLVELQPPVCTDNKLSFFMLSLSKCNSMYTKREELATTLKYINDKLSKLMQRNEYGIEPSIITSIQWLERQSFYLLQSMDFETQFGVHKMSWFLEILRFNELTFSARKYNEKDLFDYLNSIKKQPHYALANKIIFKRVSENVDELVSIYKKKRMNNFIGALWSGNVVHELLAMVDYKPASSEVGRRYREIYSQHPMDQKTGD